MTAFLLAQLKFEFYRKLVIKLPTQAQPNYAIAAFFCIAARELELKVHQKDDSIL